jgi:hypothetical protein
MGWLRNWGMGLFVGQQKRELATFLEKLKAMDGDEVGLVLAAVTHYRHALEKEGHLPMDMITYVGVNPAFALTLSQRTNAFQSAGNNFAAVAPMIWCHTARAALSLELRTLAREMWAELARGTPHVVEAHLNFGRISGLYFDIDGAELVPTGFTAKPL